MMPSSTRLSEILKEYIGRKYCILVGSGTTALLHSLLSRKFPKNSEILIPNFTCFVVPMMVHLANLKPVFIDIRKKDYNIDYEKIEEKINSKTRAIIGIHTFGASFNTAKIRQICDKHNLLLIEDFCQSFGGTSLGKLHGSHGDISVGSFAIGKTLRTKGGGLILTDDSSVHASLKESINSLKTLKWSKILNKISLDKLENPPNFLTSRILNILSIAKRRNIDIYRLAPHLVKISYLISKNSFLHSMSSYNYENIVKNLREVNIIRDKTISDSRLYKELLHEDYFSFPNNPRNNEIVWKYSVLTKVDRKKLFLEINRMGYNPHEDLDIGTSYSPPLNSCWFHSHDERYPVTENISPRIFNLPLGLNYRRKQIQKVCDILNSAAEKVY